MIDNKTEKVLWSKSIYWSKNILHVIFMLFWMNYTLIWFSLRRNGTENGLSNIKDTFAESFQLQISFLHHAWRYCFRLWVFPLTGEYFYFWHWGVLLKVKRRPHDTDPPHFRHSHPFWNFDYSPVNYDLEIIKKELFPRHRLKAHTTEQV